MAVSRFSPLQTAWLTSDSTVTQVKMVTPWILAHGLGANELRLMSEIRARTGNYTHFMGFQTAAITTDFPDLWTLSATVRQTENVFVEDFPSAGWTGKLSGFVADWQSRRQLASARHKCRCR